MAPQVPKTILEWGDETTGFNKHKSYYEVKGDPDLFNSQLNTFKYTAFGEIRTWSGMSSTDYLYTGQRNEAETGLYFYKARFYDPTLGRFIQPDTLVPDPASSGAYDRYAYVINSPINFNDPSGHCPMCVTVAVGAVVGASVDILMQTVPQLLNGASPFDFNINWSEVAGATTAGAFSGLTLGVGSAIIGAGAAASSQLAMSTIAGAIGNAAGNQAGVLVQSSIENKTPLLSKETINSSSTQHGFGDPVKITVDAVVGGIVGRISAGMSERSISSNVPKIIDSVPVNNGTSTRLVVKPLTNILGHPVIKPNMNQPTFGQTSFYSGITRLSNYLENYVTSKISNIYQKSFTRSWQNR